MREEKKRGKIRLQAFAGTQSYVVSTHQLATAEIAWKKIMSQAFAGTPYAATALGVLLGLLYI